MAANKYKATRRYKQEIRPCCANRITGIDDGYKLRKFMSRVEQNIATKYKN